MIKTIVILSLLATSALAATAPQKSDTIGTLSTIVAAPIKPRPTCKRYTNLMMPGSLVIGVRFDEAIDKETARAFVIALSYWSQTLDMTWHQDQNTETCSLELMYDPTTEDKNVIAWTYPVFAPVFDGVVRLNRKAEFDDYSHLAVSFIHELGHVFGLDHNPDTHSVMYEYEDSAGRVLTEGDLLELSTWHTLRRPIHQVAQFAGTR